MVKAIVLSAFLIVALGSLSEAQAVQHTKQDVYCLAETIFREARGTSIEEKLLVGNVVINRIKHRAFPDTACDVLYQPGQFPWIKHFSKEERLKTIRRNKFEYNDCIVMAEHLLNDKIPDNSDGALFFHTRKGGIRKWAAGLKIVHKTKHHYYYKL